MTVSNWSPSSTDDDEVIDRLKSTENKTIFRPAISENVPSDDNINTPAEAYKHSNFKYKRRGFHICNLNIRHLKPKLDDTKLLLSSSNSVDILGICETFLNKCVDDQTVGIEGYTFERKDRDQCDKIAADNGGGIIMYIANQVTYTRRSDIESQDIESIWIEVQIKNSRPFLICSVYRPPSATNDWLEQFSLQIETSLSICNEIYIMGDINIDMENGTLLNTTWKEIIETNDLAQVINKYTRVTAHSQKIIDHVYASISDNIAETFVPNIAISDHYPVCFTRSTSKNQIKRKSHKTIQYRCFKKFNENSFLNELSQNLNNMTYSATDSNMNFSEWVTTFVSILNRHAPVKTKRVKHETQPDWFTDDIRNAMKNRDIKHKLKDWSQFKYWRNKSTKLIQTAKREFFSKAISENKDNSFLWKHIKQIQGGVKDSGLPDELEVDNETSHSPIDIINKLNSYFANISDRLKASSPNNSQRKNDFQKLKNYIDNLIPENTNFKIPFMQENELITTIKKLDSTKATGLDGISAKILKLSVDIIAPSLVNIINLSIHNGQFPDTLKEAKILPIHKGGPKSDPSNYRPISILPTISKIIEKHVTKHMFGFLNKHKVLHKAQSGFRKKHSCNTALINLLDKWLKNIDKGDVVGAIFFDLRKAFDVVNHDILLKKLIYHKFDAQSLNWIKSYLSNRKQHIVHKNIKSTSQTVKSGVPQGSVLGPVLFLLFINDLPLYTNEIDVDIYADDTTVHASDKRQDIVEIKLFRGATGFNIWCIENDMFINLKKTLCMLLGTRQKLLQVDKIKLILENEIIEMVDSHKLLGLIIDKHLSWDKQIDAVCLNITRKISLLKLLSKYIDKTSMNTYYNSYILPIFDFGCLIWGRCSRGNILRMLKLQKRASRIILNADIMTPSRRMFNELKWLPFPQRVQYHTCIMVYKGLNDLAPDYINDLFIKTSEVHNRNLRSNDNAQLRVPQTRNNMYENSFAVSAAKHWNNLPTNIRNSDSLNHFKSTLKIHLLNETNQVH